MTATKTPAKPRATKPKTTERPPAPKFSNAADYESPAERDIRRAHEEVAYYVERANDPTRLRADRARFNQRANVARQRLRSLLNQPAPAPTTEEEDD